MKYDVTIGIPVYKSVDFIRRTLESALSQTYSSIEFLMVDDGGCDGSMEAIEEIKREHPRGNDIHIITHPQNMGVSASRNHIIDEAQGQYLFFMDSDDVIAENTIELMMENVRKYNAEIVFGSYEKIETSGEKTYYQYPSLQLLQEDELAIFAYRKYAGIQASACNYLVKTSVLRAHNLRFIHTNFWEDLVFSFDLVTYINRAVLLPDITYSYICRDNSLSHYQQRVSITKEEVLQNINAINHLKETSSILCNKIYYPNRCYIIAMTDFYIACNILKRRKDIHPSFSNKEIKNLMTHSATWQQVRSFRQARIRNTILFLLSKLPSNLCVLTILLVGKAKKSFNVCLNLINLLYLHQINRFVSFLWPIGTINICLFTGNHWMIFLMRRLMK